MEECEECYSSQKRVTPILRPEECLRKHTQYICSTCGRCICVEKDPKRGLRRWQFPFKSLEIAKYYLRTADVSCGHPCGIYELTNMKGRKSYKIFENVEALMTYLQKNKEKTCENMTPLYQRPSYKKFKDQQARKLTEEEIQNYLKQKAAESI